MCENCKEHTGNPAETSLIFEEFQPVFDRMSAMVKRFDDPIYKNMRERLYAAGMHMKNVMGLYNDVPDGKIHELMENKLFWHASIATCCALLRLRELVHNNAVADGGVDTTQADVSDFIYVISNDIIDEWDSENSKGWIENIYAVITRTAEYIKDPGLIEQSNVLNIFKQMTELRLFWITFPMMTAALMFYEELAIDPTADKLEFDPAKLNLHVATEE